METEASCSVHSNGDSHGDSHGDSRGQNGDHNGSSSPPKLDLSNSNGSPDLTSSKSPPSGPPNDTNGRESIKELNNRRALESPKESKGFQIHYSDTHLQNELDQQNASTRPGRSPSSQLPASQLPNDQPANRAHTESKRPDSHHSNGRPIADLRRSNECKLIDKSIDKLYTASSGAAAHHHHHKPSSTTSKPIHKSTHKSSADKPPTDCSRSIDQPANVQRPKSNDIHSKLASRSIDKSTISKSRDERSARDEKSKESRPKEGRPVGQERPNKSVKTASDKPIIDRSSDKSLHKPLDRLSDKASSSSFDKSASDKAADKPVPDKSSSDKPSSSDKSFADKPSSDKPSSDKPSLDKPSLDKPSSSNHSATTKKHAVALNGASVKPSCSKCRKKTTSNVRIQCKMDQYLSSKLSSMRKELSLSFKIPRVPLPSNDLSHLRYAKFYRTEEHPNGGARILRLYWDEICGLPDQDLAELSIEFLKESFREEPIGVAKYSISIVHNAAYHMPDFLEYMADTQPSLVVKAGIIGCSGSDIETTTMSAYRESVAKNYCRGTFRTGPLHQISVVGTAREEVGGYFPDFIDILEKCPFLKPVMPWGQLSNLKMESPQESNGKRSFFFESEREKFQIPILF